MIQNLKNHMTYIFTSSSSWTADTGAVFEKSKLWLLTPAIPRVSKNFTWAFRVSSLQQMNIIVKTSRQQKHNLDYGNNH